MSDKFTLLLWGNTQVGKTTLLATAFAPDADTVDKLWRISPVVVLTWN